MSSNDGGAAFPRGIPCASDAPGMNLRDWFAGQALAECIQFRTLACRLHKVMPDWNIEADQAAKMAYEMADAMLKAQKE